MNNKSYSEKLAHPKWQERRLEIMKRDGFKCCRCGSNQNTLNVHHKQYIKRREVWQYKDSDLETLCYICHRKEHENKPIAPAKVWEGIEERKLTNTQQRILKLQEKLKEPLGEELELQILQKIAELRKLKH